MSLLPPVVLLRLVLEDNDLLSLEVSLMGDHYLIPWDHLATKPAGELIPPPYLFLDTIVDLSIGHRYFPTDQSL